jgi:hypothetical protein
MDDEKQKKIDDLNRQIIELRSNLAADTSNIGDYKIVKTYEARLLGKDDPYDTNQLIEERNATRSKINELQEELAALEAAN